MDFSYFNPTYSKTGYFNTKIKTYPNGKSVTYYCNSSIFHKASEESEELEKAIDDILDSFDDADDLKMINLLWSLEDVKNWLGHSDIETTSNIYLHYGRSRKIMLANDMKNMFKI